MRLLKVKFRNDQAGFTMIEVLVAALITGILAAASFGFYVSMHNQTITQQEISSMQQSGRVTFGELTKSMRKAGYMLTGHPPYEILGDTFKVYFSDTQPVDTIAYYLEEFSTSEYYQVINRPSGKKFYKLMKKVNSAPAAVYAEFINGLKFQIVDATTMIVSISCETSKPDETYQPDMGYRSYVATERVNMRNITN